MGQSPGGKFEDACTRDLIHSLDSGQGLFQFTSRSAHRVDINNPAEIAVPTVAHLLAAQWEKSGPGMQLGDRYEVENLRVVPDNPPKSDVTRYEITACEIRNGKVDTSTRKSVYITQAGLRFVDKLLQPKEIKQAAALLATHPQSLLPEPMDAQTNAQHRTLEHAQTGPLICSAAGIGRSAVLAVYQDLCSRIPSEVHQGSLDRELAKAIQTGITARGPKFLHSKLQLAALRQALMEKIRDVPRSPVAGRATQQQLYDRVSSVRSDRTVHPEVERRRGINGQASVAPDRFQESQGSARTSASAALAGSTAPASSAASSDISGAKSSPRSNVAANTGNDVKAVQSELPSSAAAAEGSAASPLTEADIVRSNVDTNGAANVVDNDGDLTKHCGPEAALKPGTAAEQGATNVATEPANASRLAESTLSAILVTPSTNGARQKPWDSAKPYDINGSCLRSMDLANDQGLASISFASNAIAPAPAIDRTPSEKSTAPVMRAAALAVATAARYIADPNTKVKAADFHCATAAQKKCYDDLFGRVDVLTQHRVFEALMRPVIQNKSVSTPRGKFFEEGEVATYAVPQIN